MTDPMLKAYAEHRRSGMRPLPAMLRAGYAHPFAVDKCGRWDVVAEAAGLSLAPAGQATPEEPVAPAEEQATPEPTPKAATRQATAKRRSPSAGKKPAASKKRS